MGVTLINPYRFAAGATTTAIGVILPGTSGNFGSTPNHSSLQITGDIEVRARLLMPDWTPAAPMMILSKLHSSGQYAYDFYLNTNGTLVFRVSTTGSNLIGGTSTVALPFADGVGGWIRATRVASTGAVSFFTATDGAAVPSSWTQLGTTVTPGAGNIFAGTGQVELGSNVNGTASLLNGRIRRAQVVNTGTASVVGDFDPSLVTVLGTRNPTSLVDSTGKTWTVNGSAWDWET